jgi:hypothetical protein
MWKNVSKGKKINTHSHFGTLKHIWSHMLP